MPRYREVHSLKKETWIYARVFEDRRQLWWKFRADTYGGTGLGVIKLNATIYGNKSP